MISSTPQLYVVAKFVIFQWSVDVVFAHHWLCEHIIRQSFVHAGSVQLSDLPVGNVLHQLSLVLTVPIDLLEEPASEENNICI